MAPLCVITDFMGDDTAEETALLASRGIDVFVSLTPDPASWLGPATRADAILTRHAPIGEDAIGKMERCRIIARYGTGHDNIDIEAARRQRIIVTAVVDYATSEVADHTMALILALARALPSFEQTIRSGGWTPEPLPRIPRLTGKTLGLYGCGRIGAAVARRAAAFGMRVIAFDPHAASFPEDVTQVDDLDDLLERSNVLSLHAPLTEATRGAIDAAKIQRLPAEAIVVNVARGGLLDLEAALAAVSEGHLGGLGVDVTPTEPLPQHHAARDHTRVIVTPHVGYFSTDSVLEAKRRSVHEIIRVMEGSAPQHPVFDLAPLANTTEEP